MFSRSDMTRDGPKLGAVEGVVTVALESEQTDGNGGFSLIMTGAPRWG